MSESLASFRARARAWLIDNAPPKATAKQNWGSGSDHVAIFHDLGTDEEWALIQRIGAWQRRKYDAGFGAISWPAEFGGAGLDPAYADAFTEEEAHFDCTAHHELSSVTLHLIAPTIRLFGSDAQRADLIAPMLRGEQLCCQLFSEPSAGSDLAGLGTRAVRDGDSWIVNGQKVWSSGAHFADWGELIARHDPDLPKHAGLTAFMLAMDTPGVEVRPLRQMSGGSSFCEVFFTDVRVPDSMRLGEVGDGWKVALSTLGFERGNSSNQADVGGSFEEIVALTRYLGTIGEADTRSRLVDVYTHEYLALVANVRDQLGRSRGHPPGPVGSLRKLQWVNKMNLISAVVAAELGPRLTANTGEWGTFAWTEHVLGAPGYRIAGGSDEIQRNIIAERMLGLPADSRPDRAMPWRDIPR